MNYNKLLLTIFLLVAITMSASSTSGLKKTGDSLIVGKHTRTFSTAPTNATIVPSIKNNETSPKLVGTSTRSFEALDKVISKNYNHLLKSSVAEFSYKNLKALERPWNDSTTVQQALAWAKTTFNEIDESGNYINSLEPTDLVTLPVGLGNMDADSSEGGAKYLVGISDAKFTPEFTEITAFVRIILPQKNEDGSQRELFFGATGIKLSHSGGLLGDVKLGLLGDIAIPISGGNGALILKGGFNLSNGDINPEEMTYASIDCDGFKELALNAEVQFSRSAIVPLKPDYTVDNTNYPGTNIQKRVGAEVSIVVSDWNDILASVSLPRFALAGWEKGFVFEVNTAVFDFSDIRNSENITWPPNYQQDYLDEDFPELWKGVYINSLTIALPEQFKAKGSDERITLNATNMLIDGMGVSGDFSVDNVLPLNEGVASKWQFSVDHIEASFIANNFTKAEFAGGIVLPISKEAAEADALAQQEAINNPQPPTPPTAEELSTPSSTLALSYTAVINPATDEYILTASPTEAIRFNVWKATATIAPNSYVRLTVADNKFKPEAMLHGSMGIYADNTDPPGNESSETPPDPNAKKTVEFEGVVFEGLHLKTDAPIFQVGYLGYEGEVKLANFPISIADIELIPTSTGAKLEFDLSLNLQEAKFGATTRLAINGTFGEEQGLSKWKYKNITFSEIAIEADLLGVKFDGSLQLRDNHPIYGDGFSGNLNAEFKVGEKNIKLSANAIFGKTEYRYWYVDGLVDGMKIPVATGLYINGFGGGAFHRMKKDGFSPNFSASGAKYIPDEESGLGVKAMLMFSGESPEALSGGAGFEIAFNGSGGLNRISIYGNAKVMANVEIDDPRSEIQGKLQAIVEKEATFNYANLEQLKDTNLVQVAEDVYPDTVSGEVGINAFAAIEYDFNLQTLHGSFDLYINAADGLLRGNASGNRAGWAVVHFAPESWYVHMGTPTDRLGIKFGVGELSLETGMYLMFGDEIPGSPPPPDIVADLLGADASDLNYMRDENALGNGKGFAIGMNLALDTGDITFLIFYARLQAGLGFDIMVKDYGNAECAGSGQIGMNGWYANGQAYAYLQGELGVRVKLLFIDKKVPIIEAGIATLIQAKLPNPAWFRGYAGGNFSVLGGLVKGRFKMKVEFGEECDIIGGGPLDGLKIIADIQPGDNASDVDVFTVPQVGFNMQIGHPFNIEDEEGQTKSYRLSLKEFSLTNNNIPLDGTLEWNANGDLLTFVTDDVLPPETPLQLKVSVNFEERVNGTWRVVFDDGIEAVEEEIRNFTTGTAPDYIPESNVAYSYPLVGQKYMHRNEHGQAYIKLIQGQDYLFEDLDAKFVQRGYFMTDGGATHGPISYDASDNMVLVDIPTLQNSKNYTIKLVTEPLVTGGNATINTEFANQSLDEDTSIDVKEVSLGEAVINTEAIEMLTYDFRTSQYALFADKLNAKKLTIPVVEILESNVHLLRAVTPNTEPFDLVELEGGTATNYKPMIVVEAALDDSYYQDIIYPLIYEGYPIDNFTVDRSTNTIGTPPKEAVSMMSWYLARLEAGGTDPIIRKRMPFRYDLTHYYREDFYTIRYKITNAYMNNSSMAARYDYIINSIFPIMLEDDYKVNINYILPGGIKTSTSNYNFNKNY